MDFDSPDVEKDFPGLYASTEIGHKDSDGTGNYINIFHTFNLSLVPITSSNVIILMATGKRKEKKDRGYAALEGESSPEEEPDAK